MLRRGQLLKIDCTTIGLRSGPGVSTARLGRMALAVVLLLLPSFANAAELETRYATIRYGDEQQLHKLNRELILSRNMSYLLRGRRNMTVQDEVAAKIDLVLEQVQLVLEMFPEKLRFEILLFSTAEEAREELFKRYRKKVNFISFYSRKENALYLAAQHSELKVVAHELGHVVVEHYFDRAPPVKIHEVMARYAVDHIAD
ncbi:MAG: hypothetical protein KKG47_06695 [Proteobacteria bacterium]|nr:hypothetical protein [Pseudomonadota bacterium]MBU1739738.1 hypothetical protein [Pseudomonadota bacterium]